MKFIRVEVESRILNNARDLFFRYGLKNVTMDEIAADLGMSKKTLYEFYPNKKEIINRITENFLSDQNDAHQQVSAKSKDAVDELIQLMGLINHIFENLDVRVIYDMQRYYPEAWNIFLKHKEDFIMRDITLNLKRGIQEGLFRNDIHVEIIARMRLEQVQLAMDPRYFPAEKYNLTEVHQQLLLQYVKGLCTPSGHKLIENYMSDLKTNTRP